MRRMSTVTLSGIILFVAACSVPPANQSSAGAGNATLFEGARLITGDEVPPIEDSAFVVQDGRFTSVGRRGDVQTPEGAARVDLTGKTVMPGIIEAHAHLGYWRDLKPSAENFTRDSLLSDLQRFAYHGVTAVLSMGADGREIAWPFRDELRAHPRPDAAMYLSAGGFAMRKRGPATPLDEAVRVVTNEEQEQPPRRGPHSRAVGFQASAPIRDRRVRPSDRVVRRLLTFKDSFHVDRAVRSLVADNTAAGSG